MADIIQDLLITGVLTAIANFDKLADAGEKMFDRLDKASAGANNIGKNVDKLTEQAPELRKIEQAAYDMGTAFRDTAVNVGKATLKFAGLVAAGAGIGASVVGGLLKLTSAAADATDAIRDASIAAGTTAEEFAKLRFAAEQSGASAGKLERAFALINSGGDELEKKFQKFGVALKGANGAARDSSEVFKDFASAIEDITDPSERAAAASEVFGRRLGPGLVELLSQGRKGIEEFGKQAQALGLVFTKLELKVGDEFNDSLSKTGNVLSALKTRIGLAFAPQLTKLLDAFADAVAKIAPQINDLAASLATKLQPVIDDVINALSGNTDKMNAGWIRVTVLLFQSLGKVITDVVIPALKFVQESFDQVAGAINRTFGTNITGTDIAILLVIVKLSGALTALISVIGLVTTAFRVMGLAATLALGPVGIAIAAVLVALGALAYFVLRGIKWDAVAAAAVSAWTKVKQGATDAYNFVVTGAQQLVTAVAAFFASIPTAIVTAFQAVVTGVSDVWALILESVTTFWESLKEGFGQVVEAIVAAFLGLPDLLVEAWDGLTAAITEAFEGIKQVAVDIVTGIVEAFQSGINTLIGYWTAFRDTVSDILKTMIVGAAARASAAVQSAKSNASNGSSAPAFAGGGSVRGPGSGRSDSILAWLSNGEYVHTAASVAKYGTRFMDAVNSGALSASHVAALMGRGFRDGGFVSALRSPLVPIPAYAAGGPVGGQTGGRPLILNIGGERFDLITRDADTAEQVIRFAGKRNLQSAGRKPRHMGGK